MEPTRRAETISLDQLIASSSASVLQAFRDLEQGDRLVNPKIWVGIWIEPFSMGEGSIQGPRR